MRTSQRGSWIWRDNLRPLSVILSWMVNYDYCECDWDAIRFGLEPTTEANPYEYLIGADGQIRVSAYVDRDSPDIVIVTITLPERLADNAKTALDICNSFRLVEA